MNEMEETIQAIRDWVKNMNMFMDANLEREYLKKEGDASKVTAIFSTHGSRVLPASGESLDITLGKIRRYLSDLGSGMAYSRDYDSLSYKPIRSNFLLKHDAANEAYDGDATTTSDCNNAVLVYGIGGPSTASSKGAADFFRAYMLVNGWNKDTGFNPEASHGAVKSIQLGSVGSTARWSLKTSGFLYDTNSKAELQYTVNIPKGSYAVVQGLRLPMYTQYANNK